MAPLRMVILGRQGSGKGTQSERLTTSFGCVHLSTGDALRAAVAAGTELGRQAEKIMDSGGLVGDDVMNGIVRDRLALDDVAEAGVLLDGYPRTADQADALEAILDGLGHRLDVAVNIDVPIAEVTSRMLDRGRSDDTLEAIRAPPGALRGADRAAARLVRGARAAGHRRRRRHARGGLRARGGRHRTQPCLIRR